MESSGCSIQKHRFTLFECVFVCYKDVILKNCLIGRSIKYFVKILNIFSSLDSVVFSHILMSDMEDILPDDSVSQLSQPGSSSLNLSSHILLSEKELPIPLGIQVIDRCMVVENTPECLNKLIKHFHKVHFLNSESVNI